MIWDHLKKPSLFRYLFEAAFDWSLIAISLILAKHFNHPVGYIACIFMVGNRQHAISLLGHDAAHFSISKARWINDLVGNLTAFWPMGLNLKCYRQVHFLHHRTVGTSQDPELLHKSQRAPQWDLPKKRRQFLWLSLKDMVGFGIPDLIIISHIFGLSLGSLAIVAIIHGALICLGLWWVSAIWFISLSTSYWMFFRWRIITEHHGISGTHRIHLNPLMAFLIAPHNTWCHYEHHKWPFIPFWNLPKMRQRDKIIDVVSLGDLLSSLELETK